MSKNTDTKTGGTDAHGNPSPYPPGTSAADKHGGGWLGEAAAMIHGTTSNPPAPAPASGGGKK